MGSWENSTAPSAGLGSVLMDTNPPGWGSGICSPRGSGSAWEGRGGLVGVGGQAWGARRVRRGRCELGKLRVGAALPAPAAGLAGAPGPPRATLDTQRTQRSSSHTNTPPNTALGQGELCPSPLLCKGMGKLERIRGFWGSPSLTAHLGPHPLARAGELKK